MPATPRPRCLICPYGVQPVATGIEPAAKALYSLDFHPYDFASSRHNPHRPLRLSRLFNHATTPPQGQATPFLHAPDVSPPRHIPKKQSPAIAWLGLLSEVFSGSKHRVPARVFSQIARNPLLTGEFPAADNLLTIPRSGPADACLWTGHGGHRFFHLVKHGED